MSESNPETARRPDGESERAPEPTTPERCPAIRTRDGITTFCNLAAGHSGAHWTCWAVTPRFWTDEETDHALE